MEKLPHYELTKMLRYTESSFNDLIIMVNFSSLLKLESGCGWVCVQGVFLKCFVNSS